MNGWEAKAESEPGLEDPAAPEPNEPHRALDRDPELEDEEPKESLARDPRFRPLYAHGDPDTRPLKTWLVKGLIPAEGHGLLSGQWGTGKTFVAFDLATAVGTGQPFLGHAIKRQSGILFIAAEGADEVRLRLDAVVRAKSGGFRAGAGAVVRNGPASLAQGERS